MIQPVKANKDFSEHCMIFGEEWISEVLEEPKINSKSFFFLFHFSTNPWTAIKRLEINFEPLVKDFEYCCPWSKNKFYHFVPIAIISDSIDDELKKRYGKNCRSIDYAFDTDWARKMEKDGLELNIITQSFAGHGYTDGTLPSDGSGEFKPALIDLDNSDKIYGFVYHWYNK